MDEKIMHYDPDGVEMGEWYPGQYAGWDLEGNWVREGYSALRETTSGRTLEVFAWDDVGGLFTENTTVSTEEEYLALISEIKTIGYFENLLQGVAGTSNYDAGYVVLDIAPETPTVTNSGSIHTEGSSADSSADSSPDSSPVGSTPTSAPYGTIEYARANEYRSKPVWDNSTGQWMHQYYDWSSGEAVYLFTTESPKDYGAPPSSGSSNFFEKVVDFIFKGVDSVNEKDPPVTPVPEPVMSARDMLFSEVEDYKDKGWRGFYNVDGDKITWMDGDSYMATTRHSEPGLGMPRGVTRLSKLSRPIASRLGDDYSEEYKNNIIRGWYPISNPNGGTMWFTPDATFMGTSPEPKP